MGGYCFVVVCGKEWYWINGFCCNITDEIFKILGNNSLNLDVRVYTPWEVLCSNYPLATNYEHLIRVCRQTVEENGDSFQEESKNMALVLNMFIKSIQAQTHIISEYRQNIIRLISKGADGEE